MAGAVAASSTALRTRRRASARSRLWSRLGIAALLLGLLAIGLGLLFAGSPDKLASGTRIAGIDVGGLSPKAARQLLERRSARLATVPVTFTAAGRTFRLTPRRSGVTVDWAAAVASAERQGSGFGLVRGYRRLGLEFFPQDLAPPHPGVRRRACDYELGLLARAINAPHREARLVRRGLHITIAPGATGRVLDRSAARALIVARARLVLARARRVARAERRAVGDRCDARRRAARRHPRDLRADHGGRRPDAAADPALAARDDPRPADGRCDAPLVRRPRRRSLLRTARAWPRPRAEGRGLRGQRLRQRPRRAGGGRDRDRRSAVGRAHARRGRAFDEPRRPARLQRTAAAPLDRAGAGDGDHRHGRRPTRRSTAARRTGSTTSSSSRISSTAS